MLGARRDRCLHLLTLAAAGCLATPPSGNAELDAGDAGQNRIDRQSAPGQPIPDDDPSGVSDEIAVATECTIAALEVDVEIRHQWRSDLEVTLDEPGGGHARLYVAGANDQQDDLVGTYPVTLSPYDSLDRFLGLPAAGSWVMRVADVSTDDIGTFETWGLHIECR